MISVTRFFGKLCLAAVGLCALAGHSGLAQIVQTPVAHGIASDWTRHHVLYPHSDDYSKMAQVQNDRRWAQDWYGRHQQLRHEGRQDFAKDIYEGRHREPRKVKKSARDWSFALGTAAFEPLFDFSFTIGTQTGSGSLNVADQGNGQYLATVGSLTVTGAADVGTYTLNPGGPAVATSPSGGFNYDNLLFPTYPTLDPSLDTNGLLFVNSSAAEINIWGNGPGAYEFDDKGSLHDVKGAPFTLSIAPGGGQTYPAKFVFNATTAPSCTNDFVVMGMPSNPVSAGQANILGLNNLYTGTGGFCTGTAPSVKFAYASGSGEVPANVSLSQDGTRIAYIENRLAGSSYLHVLTIGTTGSNGTSATGAVVPGVGNNASDKSVLLSPDGGVTNQSSTSSVFVAYTLTDKSDVAFATTYSAKVGISSYLYKLSNIFNGTTTPTIVWSVPINALPSSPVYDTLSNKVFFTDSAGRVDYVTNSATAPSVVYGPVVANGTTSENPVVIDSTNQVIYASFNSNGTNAVVVQMPISLSSFISVPVGTANTTYTGPYAPDFNNAFYTGSGTPVMYVAGTGTGTVPTLYSVGFDATGHMKTSSTTSAALTTGLADASPVTEFYNATLHKDFLFVGVTNHCIATMGQTAGCVLSLDITAGSPTVGTGSTALAAPGGTTGIVVDNDSTLSQASSIYYATKSGHTMVKATQAGLN